MTLRRAATFTLLLALLSGAAHAAGVDPRDATPVQREQAQARFQKGKTKYDGADYTHALEEFQGSLDIVQSPNTRLYVARCYREMGRLVDAYVEFGRTAIEAKEHSTVDNRYDKARDAATAEREALATHLGFITVSVQNAGEDTKLVVGGAEVKRAAWSEPAPVMPGNVEIQVSTPNRETVTKTVPVKVGDKMEVSVDAGPPGAAPPPPPPPPSSTSSSSTSLAVLRPVSYVVAGVGVVGFVMLAVAGPMSQSTYSSLQKQCGAGPCPTSLKGTVDRGRTEQSVANAGLAMGIIGLAAAGALFGLSFVGSSPSSAAGSTAPAARLVFGPGSVGVEGRF